MKLGEQKSYSLKLVIIWNKFSVIIKFGFLFFRRFGKINTIMLTLRYI